MSNHPSPTGAAFADVVCAIHQSGGWLRFDRYLAIVQHGRNGYYGGGNVCFGGDFVTAPIISPLFGAAMSGQVAQILHHCGGGVLELGAGDGTLARQIINNLKCTYEIVEPSPALRERQKQNLAGFAVKWRKQIPKQFTGAIIANEVLDSIPFRLLRRRENQWFDVGIITKGKELAFAERPMIDKTAAAKLPPDLPDGYQTEVAPLAELLIRQTAAALDKGAAVFVDYGFGAAEYYHKQRTGGTMMCHHRHLADDNPLRHPGKKDITAHVDFSAMANAADCGGAEVLGYATQAAFLVDCGMIEMLKACDDADALRYAKLCAGAQKLLSPSEMGEFVKVLAFGKGAPPLVGFRNNDRRHCLSFADKR